MRDVRELGKKKVGTSRLPKTLCVGGKDRPSEPQYTETSVGDC